MQVDKHQTAFDVFEMIHNTKDLAASLDRSFQKPTNGSCDI